MIVSFLNSQQQELFKWVEEYHRGQVRKYTHTPYTDHLLAVAGMVHGLSGNKDYRCIVEVALCHDLFEDTMCSKDELYSFLIGLGYSKFDSHLIVTCAFELTDVFVHNKFPEMNRSVRKRLEAERLGSVTSLSQTVKYAIFCYKCGKSFQMS